MSLDSGGSSDASHYRAERDSGVVAAGILRAQNVGDIASRVAAQFKPSDAVLLHLPEEIARLEVARRSAVEIAAKIDTIRFEVEVRIIAMHGLDDKSFTDVIRDPAEAARFGISAEAQKIDFLTKLGRAVTAAQ